jgi:hypothetical protein
MNKAIDLARNAITALLEGDRSEQQLEDLVTELEQLVQEDQIVLSPRDYFAMHIIQSLVDDPSGFVKPETIEALMKQKARLAYKWADAMMAVREE